uniref:Dolichyl-diphosphooligosaccharide--protein glycosyltransferase subunit STT3A n=1 Tax=Ditylenchus dipsaci TaxID=166011 RepID=A0A915CR64_9BILA
MTLAAFTSVNNLQQRFGKPELMKSYETLLKLVILVLAGVVAFSVRLFAVIRFESVIHDLTLLQLSDHKVPNRTWLLCISQLVDEQAWYPLGRIIGGTIYPGLMVTSWLIHRIMNAINVTVDIREVCVFLAPLFSSFTVFITYLFTKEIQNEGAGLVAAALIAIVPGYISRSVAGSYDNEAIAIFCMLLTYYLWIKSVKTGSVFYSAACALAYFYMVSSWGGYVFLINLIPLHVLALICTGRFTHRAYVAYSTLNNLIASGVFIGTILSMQIPFVGFQPVSTSEHMGAFGVFGLCQIVAFSQWMRSKMAAEKFQLILRSILLVAGGAGMIALIVASFFTVKIAPWTGRFYSLLDPSYAKNNIPSLPLCPSISQLHGALFTLTFNSLCSLSWWVIFGLYFCFKSLNDQNIFVILYGVTSIYFAGVMVRLMLVLAPIMCVMGGIAVSGTLTSFIKNIDLGTTTTDKPTTSSSSSAKPTKSEVSFKTTKKQKDDNYPYKSEIATAVVGLMTVFLLSYVFHCTWVTSEAYSSPSIVLSARSGEGRIIFDDFRESYYWLRQNTPDDAKIMSWWDYGYQITAMANRTVLVDNNTWNNTHISRVGQAMSSNESHAYEIMRELDVDYVLVIFGGVTGYSSDDINKFLWMVRIGGSTPEGAHIKERDYYTKNGEFRVDREGSPAMLNCLMYKLCFYRFGAVYTEHGKATGYDRVRHAEIGNKDFELEHLEEAYTTEHWIVRIYKVLKPNNRK